MAGRRMNRLTPAASLLVTKPRGDVAHEGGIRFSRGSLSDQILTHWIAQGTPSDLTDTAQVVRIRLVPDMLALRPRDGTSYNSWPSTVTAPSAM